MSFTPPAPLRALAVAAALCLSASPVLAASSASVLLSNVQLLLVDLNPDDGISPSVSFGSGSSRGDASASFTQPGSSGSETASFNGLFGAWSPGSAAVSGPYSSASSVLAGSGTATGSVLSTTGNGTAPGSGFCLPGDSGFNTCFNASASFSASLAPLDTFGQFVLSANTLLVLTADASMQVAATGGGRVQQFDSLLFTNGDSASAGVSLSMSGPGPTGSGSQSSSDGRSLFATAFYDFGSGLFVPAGDAFNGSVGVSFTNLSGGSLTGNLNFSQSVNGTAYGDALLVPEPGAWALMLAGLAAVAGVARRRR